MSKLQTQTSKEATNGVKSTLGEICCPFCGKPITAHEYDKATQDFKRRIEQEYGRKFNESKKLFEDQTLEQERRHRLEIEYLKKNHLDQLSLIQKEFRSSQEKHLEDLKNRYNEFRIQKDKDLNEKLQHQILVHEKEMKEKEKLHPLYAGGSR